MLLVRFLCLLPRGLPRTPCASPQAFACSSSSLAVVIFPFSHAQSIPKHWSRISRAAHRSGPVPLIQALRPWQAGKSASADVEGGEQLGEPSGSPRTSQRGGAALQRGVENPPGSSVVSRGDYVAKHCVVLSLLRLFSAAVMSSVNWWGPGSLQCFGPVVAHAGTGP